MYSYIGKEFKKNLFWKVYSDNVRTIFDQTEKEQLEILLQCPITKTGKWNELAYHFKWRTAIPLGPTSAPGCDEPTSRCQTPPSIWTLGRYQPVIPGVPFIRWAMALPFRTTGSLWPAFAPARAVTLAVKLAYAIALTSWCPTRISQPSCSSVTL